MSDDLICDHQNTADRLEEIAVSDNAGPAGPHITGRVEPTSYSFYDIFMVISATVAVCSNMLALKVVQVSQITFGGAVVFFPVSYILGDVVTEVYGFKRARRVIWVTFGALVFASFMTWAILAMPPAPGPYSQAMDGHFQAVFSTTPRIIFASMLAFLLGDYVNSVTLAIMKVKDGGKRFWKRAIGSTVFGQATDTLAFYPLAFAGVWTWDLLVEIMITHYTLKVAVEVVCLPLTTGLVRHLKRVERIDHYDKDTRFTPFGLDM